MMLFSLIICSYKVRNREEIVAFDSVYLNHDGGWDPHTYHFVAPVPGPYSFTISAITCHNQTVVLHLINGDIHSISRTDNSGGGDRQTAATTSMLLLDANAEVWVDTTSAISRSGNKESFFIGFLYDGL